MVIKNIYDSFVWFDHSVRSGKYHISKALTYKSIFGLHFGVNYEIVWKVVKER
jgi:hypothetical protein